MPNKLCNFEPTPEQRTPPYSKAADVWSSGSTLVKVLTGHKLKAPNAVPSCEDYVNDLVDGLICIIDQGATEEVHRVEVLRDVLRMCLKERPSERASVGKIFIIVRAWEGQADFIDLAREVHVMPLRDSREMATLMETIEELDAALLHEDGAGWDRDLAQSANALLECIGAVVAGRVACAR